MFFGGLVNTIVFLIHGTCAETVNITSMAYNGKMYDVKTKKYYTQILRGKALMEREI